MKVNRYIFYVKKLEDIDPLNIPCWVQGVETNKGAHLYLCTLFVSPSSFGARYRKILDQLSKGKIKNLEPQNEGSPNIDLSGCKPRGLSYIVPSEKMADEYGYKMPYMNIPLCAFCKRMERGLRFECRPEDPSKCTFEPLDSEKKKYQL